MLKLVGALFISLLISLASIAKPASFAAKAQFDLFAVGSYGKYAISSVNPYNRILEIPETTALSDLRGELKLVFHDRLRLVVRPHFTINYFVTSYQSPDEKKYNSIGKIDLTALYLDWALFKSTIISAGLMNYQWGPAELLSPSNVIFHLEPNQRAFLYLQKGHVMGKININLSSSLNLTTLYEFMNNQEPNWISNQPFTQKVLVKLEKKFSNSFDYFGLTGGTLGYKNAFLGEYFNFVPWEGISIYADAVHIQGNQFFAPQLNQYGLYDMNLTAIDYTKINSLVIGGFRYEGPIDARIEYVYQTAGYDLTTLQQAVSSAIPTTNPNFVQNFTRFGNPGLEVPGRQYAYLSIRKPNIFDVIDFNVALRTLKSLQDNSISLQLDLDKPLSGTLTGYIEATQSYGDQDTELMLLAQTQIWAGVKYSF